MRHSGPDPFFYGVPHDHNFSFLTVGYLGPGYWSDYYEYDYGAVVGFPGEDVALRFVEKSRLEQGKVMLYRAHRDIHLQLPADAMSVSLNILETSHNSVFRDQYRFDVERSKIAGIMTRTSLEPMLALDRPLWRRGRRGPARAVSPPPIPATGCAGRRSGPRRRPRRSGRPDRGARAWDTRGFPAGRRDGAAGDRQAGGRASLARRPAGGRRLLTPVRRDDAFRRKTEHSGCERRKTVSGCSHDFGLFGRRRLPERDGAAPVGCLEGSRS